MVAHASGARTTNEDFEPCLSDRGYEIKKLEKEKSGGGGTGMRYSHSATKTIAGINVEILFKAGFCASGTVAAVFFVDGVSTANGPDLFFNGFVQNIEYAEEQAAEIAAKKTL